MNINYTHANLNLSISLLKLCVPKLAVSENTDFSQVVSFGERMQLTSQRQNRKKLVFLQKRSGQWMKHSFFLDWCGNRCSHGRAAFSSGRPGGCSISWTWQTSDSSFPISLVSQFSCTLCVRLGTNPLQNDIISKQPNFGNKLTLVFRLMSTRKWVGPGTDPWGMPETIWPNADTSHSTSTCPVLLTRKLLTHWCICPWKPEQRSWRRTCLSKLSKRVPVWSPQQALPPGHQPGLKQSVCYS